MSTKISTRPATIDELGTRYVEFSMDKGRLSPTPAPRRRHRIEDIPVSEVETTGPQNPVYDRVVLGGVALDTPPIPTVPERIAEDELDQIEALQAWWSEEAEKDAEACLSKLIEYGSADFDIMAQTMLAVGGAIWSGVPDDERMRVGREMAIGFYLQGKVARAFGAFEHGRMPTVDTINDIVRYGMMWKRVRQTGAWA